MVFLLTTYKLKQGSEWDGMGRKNPPMGYFKTSGLTGLEHLIQQKDIKNISLI